MIKFIAIKPIMNDYIEIVALLKGSRTLASLNGATRNRNDPMSVVKASSHVAVVVAGVIALNFVNGNSFSLT